MIAYHPISSEADIKEALRQIDANFREIVAEIQNMQMH